MTEWKVYFYVDSLAMIIGSWLFLRKYFTEYILFSVLFFLIAFIVIFIVLLKQSLLGKKAKYLDHQ